MVSASPLPPSPRPSDPSSARRSPPHARCALLRPLRAPRRVGFAPSGGRSGPDLGLPPPWGDRVAVVCAPGGGRADDGDVRATLIFRRVDHFVTATPRRGLGFILFSGSRPLLLLEQLRLNGSSLLTVDCRCVAVAWSSSHFCRFIR